MRYYSTRQTFLIVSSTIKVEETKKIDKYLEVLDKSGVCDLIREKVIHDEKNKGGRPGYNVYNMLAGILYSFAFNKASLRNIEDLCLYDLRVIYIMENETPTYKTIGNFINEYIIPNRDKIFSLITKAIFEECNLKMDKGYIDGSKFEADANKYKFVWKPTTFHLKLSDKIRKVLGEYNLLRGVRIEGIIESKIVANKLIELANIVEEYDLSLKNNKSHKEAYKKLYQYLEKSLEYEEKERICGPNRNSYFKTDIDATAMCLKEDYYSGLGSNMHAAYNVQLCVIYGLISSLVTQSRNDFDDFIKILEKQYEMYGCYLDSIGADAGYGSLKNYQYLKEHNIKNFVKYSTWEGNVSGKRPSQYRINNDNTITCLKGNTGFIEKEPPSHPRKKNTVFYKIDGCNDCEYRDYCKRFMKDKTQNIKYFEVSTEFMLVCLGYNIRKLFKFYSGNAKFDYWKAPIRLQAETFKKPSAKRLSNKVNKKKNKSLNEETKSKYKYK